MLISSEICDKFSDQEIISKSLENIDFFSCLYQRYEIRLLRYINRISKFSKEETEDILQEAFVKIWKNLHSFDTSLKLSSWLYRIVHNQVVSNWRKEKLSRKLPILELKDTMLQNIGADMQMESIDRQAIQQQLNHLPDKYREVLILKYFEDMSYEEISDILKIPEGTVAIRLSRAKKAFKLLGNKS